MCSYFRSESLWPNAASNESNFSLPAIDWFAVADSDGETDLIVAFENKIAANFQPEQGERYQKRAARWRSIDAVSAVATVLIAPSEYIVFNRERFKPPSRRGASAQFSDEERQGHPRIRTNQISIISTESENSQLKPTIPSDSAIIRPRCGPLPREPVAGI